MANKVSRILICGFMAGFLFFNWLYVVHTGSYGNLHHTDEQLTDNSYLFSRSPKPEFSINQQEEVTYNSTVIWDTPKTINESITMPINTHLIINNTQIDFLVNESTILHLENDSKLEIHNSIITSNEESTGSYQIKVTDSIITITNSIIEKAGRAAFTVYNCFSNFSNTTFKTSYLGIDFEDCIETEFLDCRFENINSTGIRYKSSHNLTVLDSKFKNVEFASIRVYSGSYQIVIGRCVFEEFCNYAIEIPYSDWQCYGIWIMDNEFSEGTGDALFVSGAHIYITNNFFFNLTDALVFTGYRIDIQRNTFIDVDVAIKTREFKWGTIGVYGAFIDAVISDNKIIDSESGIHIINYDDPTPFVITNNTFRNITSAEGAAFIFEGNLGGEGIKNPCMITNNFINGSKGYGIIGLSYDYLARFKYTNFIQNAFLKCERGITNFQEQWYYLVDVYWDNGMYGNFWDTFLPEAEDEDNNNIADNFMTVSAPLAQFDNAPLLSLDLVYKQNFVGSTHPADIIRLIEELEGPNNTITWITNAQESDDITVFLDGNDIEYLTETNNSQTNVTVVMEKFKPGKHNLTLIITLNDYIYHDLIWVTILGEDKKSDWISFPIVSLSMAILVILIRKKV